MSDMTDIYIVTSGEYSDYCIEAVFSTKEKADAFLVDRYGAEQYGRYEVWEIDAEWEPYVDYLNMTVTVYPNGEIEERESAGKSATAPACESRKPWRREWGRPSVGANVWGRDLARVRKRYSELRAQAQAEMDAWVAERPDLLTQPTESPRYTIVAQTSSPGYTVHIQGPT